MNEQLKKRLIGAVVLVALAAIFVPMLFNGGEQTEKPTFSSNLPSPPDEQFQTIEVPLQVPPEQPVEIRPVTTEAEADAYEATDPAAPRPAPEEAADVSLPAPSEATPTVISGDKGSTPAAPKPKPAASTVQPGSSWVVQLGSFGKSANALALRDKMRKKGYSAFVEQQKGSTGTVYRVRIGPEVKRENAEALKAKLQKAGIKGVVMSHP